VGLFPLSSSGPLPNYKTCRSFLSPDIGRRNLLADFTVTIHDVYKPMAVRVKVHENLRAMHSAVTQSDNRWGGRKKRTKGQHKDTLAICQRFHMSDSPVYSIVRFAPPHVGAGIVAHEMAHAAVWLWEIKNKFEDVPLACDNDEWFAWVLGELVRRTTTQLHDNGVYSK
jgi:hypothetical protein